MTVSTQTTKAPCNKSSNGISSSGHSAKLSTEVPIFLRKTYHMIDTCDENIASWADDGSTFVVKQPETFEKEIIPQFFKHNKFSSFVRQLNFYGFRKIKFSDSILIDEDLEKKTANFWKFRHENFKRGREDLLMEIKRSHNTNTGAGVNGNGGGSCSGSGSGSGSGTVNGTMDNNDKNNTTTTTTPMGIRPKIEYLIIMNSNNDKRANRTFPMRKEAGESDLEDIGLVSMGYSNGMHLLCSMVFRNEISNNNNNDKNNNGQETGQQESILGMGTDMYLDSMAFLPLDSDQRTARDWMFPVNIDAMTVDGGSMKNKLLLVFILVTLLFPIVRMVLFCCIHHREFQWRRNERGRINGFTWSRRMLDMEHDTASWIGAFTGRNGLNSDARGPIVLSPEGVKKLPIIEFGVESVQDVMARYRWLSSDYNDDDDENDNKNRNVNHELKRLHHVDNHHQQGRSYYHDDDDIPKSQDENNNKTEKDLIAVAYDSCVTCSICICDFEHGEKLRLLPDCGHVFHTECIMPWLTGKKNSCPLCQRKVKVSEEDMGYRDDESFQLRIATSLISGQDQRNTSMNVSESFEQSDAPVSVEREEQNDDLSTASTNHSSRHEEGSSSSSSSSNDVDALSSSRTDSNIYP